MMEVKRVLSAKPERLKINRKSIAACNLKSAISDKLRHFLANYSDDVLAEYITVLVCNGKNQYQARDDLDAFLGDETPEFVSWLWGHLLKYAWQTDEDTGFSHPNGATDTCSGNSNGHDDSRIEKSRDFPSHGTVHPDHMLETKDENINRLPASTCNSGPSNKMEFAEGFRCHPGFTSPSHELNFSTVLSQTNGNKSFTYETSGKGIHPVIPADGEQRILCLDKPKKMVNSNCNGQPNEALYLPKRGPISRNFQSSASEYPCLQKSGAHNVLRTTVSPRSVCSLTRQNENSRVSVWDRLGKPCDDTTEKFEIAKDCEPSRSIKVPGLERNCGDNNPSKYREMEHGMSVIHKPNTETNVGRKRHFGEISHGPATASVSLVGYRNNDLQGKEISQESKKSILASVFRRKKAFMLQEMLDVKQKLHQMEMEMSKLRSRQVEMKKDVKINSLLQSGAPKHAEKDSKSRTVLVTNVSFTATEESLLLYFSKCGVVDKVVISTDKASVQARRSANVTFASKESVEKAVALSGRSFFSRNIKVVRKAEAAALTTPARHAPNTYQVPLSYLNRKASPCRPYYSGSHLQWRRDFASAPLQLSAQVIVERNGINTSKQQGFPSSAVSKANSSTEPAAAV